MKEHDSKASTAAAGILVAGFLGLACSRSGLKSREVDGGEASGGQAGSSVSGAIAGGNGGGASTGGSVSSAGTSGSSAIGGTIPHGGVSGRSGSGGVVSLGGISGAAGRGGVGGATGSGGSSVTCIPPPCAPAVCPDGYIVAPSNDCDCSGPCGCPCGCWTCVPAPESPDASTSKDASVSDGPSGTTDATVPLQHRSTPASCPPQRAPGPSCANTMCSSCSSDSQCTDGKNGRCFPWEGLVGPGGCSYDECFTDSNCGSKIPCLCRSSSADNSANVCNVAGNCAVDSDCGPCGYCSPSAQILSGQPPNVCWGSSPYYCHTTSDLCLNDSDCALPDAGLTTPFPPPYTCAYNPEDNRWECTKAVCAIP